MQIQIINPSISLNAFIPGTPGSAGIDLIASIKTPLQLGPGSQISIPAGIKTAIPVGYVGLIIPRSGLGTKGMVLANTTGVVDPDYRGEIQVVLLNRSKYANFIIHPYDRIAQMVIVPYYPFNCIEFSRDSLDETVRGSNGFGSTGI